MKMALRVFLLATALAGAQGAQTQANPIRKVVTMLQSMQAKVEAEGEKEAALYEKFMCYCKTSGGDLQASIDAANTKMPELASDIKASSELKAETETDLKQAQEDRAAAKTAMAEATALREKEAAAFAAEKAEYGANIAAVTKAIAAVEKGASGAFVQTGYANAVRKIASNAQSIMEDDRETLLSFLSGEQGYAPQSGGITGILKGLSDEMQKGLGDATATEEAAIKAYGEMMAAKKKEVAALSAGIEAKLEKIAELGVSIAQMKNDLTDTEEALMADQAFIAELEKSCKTKTAEWEEIKKTRSEELLALADTIKVLNDDDALELFKKTLPSASASFMQVRVSTSTMRAKAMAALAEVRKASTDRVHLDVILLALRGKKIGFEKVIKMIDEMVATLKKEQQDDEAKQEYCAAQFDLTDDKKKSLERLISDKETAMANAEEAIKTLAEEIAALKAGITALDKDVAEATAQRKEENSDYSDLMASDTAAKELMGFAKNRLNKFYNPKLYKAPAKRELSAEDRIAVNMEGGTAPPTEAPGGIAGTGIAVLAQITAHVQQKNKDAPPPPPETFGAYTKKSEENTGVIAMIDLLIKDLDKEMTEAETAEKDAQGDYEQLMKDSAEKRTKDTKSLTEKEKAKADTEAALETYTEEKASASKELMATMQYLSTLHAECDWLMKYFDMRKEARDSEIDALGKAKAVLSGADFSLIQTRSRGYLRRSQ